jgi:ribulose-5-phosphate 4-epimerase/fuculose-1-phosphate aldolase
MATPASAKSGNNDHLIKSADPKHPANLIPELCRKFWSLGWVTGTGGGTSIRDKYAQISETSRLDTNTHMSQ